MPVSKKQLRANRQNAQKSTGPKSVEGKAIASRNGLKYGLYSQDIIITSQNLTENPEEYDLLMTSLLGELQPETGFQLYLVHRIANCLWRSRRAIRAETAEITNQVDDVDDEYDFRKDYRLMVRKPDGSVTWKDRSPEDVRRIRSLEIARQSIPDEESSSKILRYEMRLDRQLTRAYKLLCQLQDRQDRKQTKNEAPTEIFVPVFKCPAEHGLECPRNRRPAEGHRGRQERIPDAAMLEPDFVATPEEGFARPTIHVPIEVPGSIQNQDRATIDAIESRPRGAGHPHHSPSPRLPLPPKKGPGARESDLVDP